jgi:hypothetical protein
VIVVDITENHRFSQDVTRWWWQEAKERTPAIGNFLAYKEAGKRHEDRMKIGKNATPEGSAAPYPFSQKAAQAES